MTAAPVILGTWAGLASMGGAPGTFTARFLAQEVTPPVAGKIATSVNQQGPID